MSGGAGGPHPDFWELLEPKISWIHRQLRRLGVHERDLDDVCQEVLIRVHGKWRSYDAARPLKAWVFGFCFRVCSDYRRRAVNRRQVLVDDVYATDERPNAEQEAMRNEGRGLVVRALQELSDGLREVFVMYEIEELAMQDIAETLEIPVNTGYSRLRKARSEFAVAVRRVRARDEARTVEQKRALVNSLSKRLNQSKAV